MCKLISVGKLNSPLAHCHLVTWVFSSFCLTLFSPPPRPPERARTFLAVYGQSGSRANSGESLRNRTGQQRASQAMPKTRNRHSVREIAKWAARFELGARWLKENETYSWPPDDCPSAAPCLPSLCIGGQVCPSHLAAKNWWRRVLCDTVQWGVSVSEAKAPHHQRSAGVLAHKARKWPVCVVGVRICQQPDAI